ncbi:EamA family transporter, partial [Mesorhizobium sp. M2D.F.Ca.ET.145.01.1.1]
MQAVPIAHPTEQSAAASIPSLSGYPAAVLCWLLSA